MELFLFFLVFFFSVFVLRTWIVWKRTSIMPFRFNRKDDAHGYIGRIYAFVLLLEFLIVSIYAFKSAWYKYLLPCWYFENSIISNIGWALLMFSLIIIWVAQSHMADSWRIGIDHENKPRLVTNGIFSLSRNPVFLGIILASVGVFMVVPNAFTLLILGLSFVSINTQIRLEEEHLQEEFGNSYSEYRSKVRRWI